MHFQITLLEPEWVWTLVPELWTVVPLVWTLACRSSNILSNWLSHVCSIISLYHFISRYAGIHFLNSILFTVSNWLVSGSSWLVEEVYLQQVFPLKIGGKLSLAKLEPWNPYPWSGPQYPYIDTQADTGTDNLTSGSSEPTNQFYRSYILGAVATL